MPLSYRGSGATSAEQGSGPASLIEHQEPGHGIRAAAGLPAFRA